MKVILMIIFGGFLFSVNSQTVEKTLDDIYTQIENLNQQISSIVSTSTNMSDYVDELRTKDSSIGIGH